MHWYSLLFHLWTFQAHWLFSWLCFQALLEYGRKETEYLMGCADYSTEKNYKLSVCFIIQKKKLNPTHLLEESVSICCDTHVAHAYGRTQFAIVRSFPCMCISTIYIIIRTCFVLLYTFHLSIFIIIYCLYISNILSIFITTETLLLVFTIYSFLKMLVATKI